MPQILDTPEYRLIAGAYAARAARRSRVRYIRHIDEGLAVLAALPSSEFAMRAFALHPLVQSDADLAVHFDRLVDARSRLHPRTVALALEYRSVANAFLSPMEDHAGYHDPAAIRLSPLEEVNDMLVADKVQNYKDFVIHHRASHPRASWLERYFRAWLERLGVSDRLAELIDECERA